MFIRNSRLASKASGRKDLSDAVNKALTTSALLNEKTLDKLNVTLEKAIQSGNESLVVSLNAQQAALSKALELKKSQGAKVAEVYRKGERLSEENNQPLQSYLKGMASIQASLETVVKTSLLDISKSVTEAVNGDTSDKAKMASARQLAKALSNAGLFDESPSFQQLLTFLHTQQEVNDTNRESLIRIVDAVNSEVQTTDRLNDLIKVASKSSATEEEQAITLTQISSLLTLGSTQWKNLDKLNDILNSNKSVAEKISELKPELKHVGDQSLRTRTLYTLQQIEAGLKHQNDRRWNSSKAKLQQQNKENKGSNGNTPSEGTHMGTSLLSTLAGYVPGFAAVDTMTGGAISDKLDTAEDIAGAYATAKVYDKVRKKWKSNKAGAGVESSVEKGAEKSGLFSKLYPKAETAMSKLKAGGLASSIEKGGIKSLAKAGKWGALLAAGGALLYGTEASASEPEQQVPVKPNMPVATKTDDAANSQILPVVPKLASKGANPVTELGIYGGATLAEKSTGNLLGGIASKTIGSAATKAGGAILSKANGLANLAVGSYDYFTADNTNDRKKAVVSTAGSAGGMWAGAAAGAALGSVVPIIGTTIGGIAGGIIGSLGGNLLGDALVDSVKNPEDDIPDEIKKKGGLYEACYIDQMIASGQYDKADVASLRKIQASLVNKESISSYAGDKTGGNTDSLLSMMKNSPMKTEHPEVFKQVESTLKPQPKAVAALPVESRKNKTDISSLSPKEQSRVDDIVEEGMQNAKADPETDKSLVSKLMGWVSNVMPTGIYPMLTVGVNNNNTIALPDDYSQPGERGGGGGYYGGTKGESGGTLPTRPSGSYSGPRAGYNASTTEKIADKVKNGTLGSMSAFYESGSKGARAISTGRGDAGGVSYGSHQLASNTGTMANFLSSKEGAQFSQQFAGLKPGSAEFNAKYKEVTSSEQGAAQMDAAQNAFIKRTHYDVLADKVQKDTGIDINKQSRAVQEAVYSSSVQYGGGTSTVSAALKQAGIDGKDGKPIDQKKMLNAIYQYKLDHVSDNFRSSSPAVQASVAKRIQGEWDASLAVLNNGDAKKTAQDAEEARKDSKTNLVPTKSGVPAVPTKGDMPTAPAVKAGQPAPQGKQQPAPQAGQPPANGTQPTSQPSAPVNQPALPVQPAQQSTKPGVENKPVPLSEVNHPTLVGETSTNTVPATMPTGSVSSVSGVTPVASDVPTASSGTMAETKHIEAAPLVLESMPKVVQQSVQPAPVRPSSPAPAPTGSSASKGGSGASVTPPMQLDDYGLLFANKLLWDH